MKKSIITLVALVTMLSLTACGEAGTNEKTSEKAVEVTTASYEAEEDPAAEDDANEEAVAEEEITEAVTEAEAEAVADETFKPAEGLSSKYADLDNRSFVYNGHLFTLGKTTMQEMVDAGVTFKGNSDEKMNKEVGPASDGDDTVHKSLTISESDSQSIGCEFINITGSSIPAKECVICYVSALLYDNRGAAFNVSESGAVEFAFPKGITREDLYANSGDPTEIDDDLNRVDYLVDSTMFDDDSGYKFFFEDNKLCEVHMSWLP